MLAVEQLLLGTAASVLGGLIMSGMAPLARRIYKTYRSDALNRSRVGSVFQNRELTFEQDSVDRLAEYGARRLLHRALRREIEKRDRKA